MDIIKEKETMYILDDGHVRCFLFLGDEEALLVDCGFPNGNVYEEVCKLTSLPVRLVLTHGDMDHIGDVLKFKECYVHPADAHMLPEGVMIHELAEKMEVSVGDYHFEVLHIPGHTYGSIALLERNKRLMISGDSVQEKGPIFMFGKERNKELYVSSLQKLAAIADDFDLIYPSHNACPIPPKAINECLEDALIINSNQPLSVKKHPKMPCDIYHGKYTDYLI